MSRKIESEIVARVEPLLAQLNEQIAHCKDQILSLEAKLALFKAKQEAALAVMEAIRGKTANKKKAGRPAKANAVPREELENRVRKLFTPDNPEMTASTAQKAIRPQETYARIFYALMSLVNKKVLGTKKQGLKRVFFLNPTKE
jgi:hypothetical protein